MDFSIRRINALLKKEVKDLGKNTNVLLMFILPIIFSFLYTNMLGANMGGANAKFEILKLCLGMNLTCVSVFVIAMLMAEEKEKNTLRTLMLSSVSPLDFLAGKAIITIVLSLVNDIIIFFAVGMDIKYLGSYILLTTLVMLSLVVIGAIIGLLAQNQMSTGVVGFPIMMILLLMPMLSTFNGTVARISSLLANYNLYIILEKVFKNEDIGASSIYNIAIILIWCIIAPIVFAYVYNRKGLDK